MPTRFAVIAVAAALACLALAAPAGAARPAGTRCDQGIDLGFTTAKVFVRNMTCVRGRQILRKWRDLPENPAPKKTVVAGYTCRFGGTELQLTVRCTKGRKLARMRWGG